MSHFVHLHMKVWTEPIQLSKMLESDHTAKDPVSFEGFMARATAWLLGGLSCVEILTWLLLLSIGKLGPIDLWLLPSLATSFMIMLGLLWWRPSLVKQIQTLVLIVLSIYELIDLFSSSLPEVQAQSNLGVGMVWFPGIIVAAFLVLRHRIAVRLGVIYILIGIALGVYYFRAGISPLQLTALLQFYASNVGILAVSWVFGHMRSQFLEMRTMAYTDTLTGLLNRRAMNAYLEAAQSNDQGFCVLAIDIDQFKRVNDTFGHPVGDQALREMALTLESHIRKTDQIARWGGEEFLVLTLGANLVQAQQLADRLLEAVRAANIAGLGLTVSIGISERRANSTLETMLSMADAALYQAKSAGRNRAEIVQNF
jgi:diguanylate cyclase (GGDEF)-like protein